MKVIKIVFLYMIALNFAQCKRDDMEESIINLLNNGKYGITLEFGPRSEIGKYYYLNDNFFYPVGKNSMGNDTICFARKAGELIKDENGDLSLTPVQMIVGGFDPCVFYTDVIGGDTFVLHFSNIIEFTDNFSKKGLKGDFYYFVPKTLPYSKLEGKFTLLPS